MESAPVIKPGLGERIQAARIAKGHATAASFARALGTPETNVYRWEKGDVLPGTEWVAKIARECEVSIDALIGGESAADSTESTTEPKPGAAA